MWREPKNAGMRKGSAKALRSVWRLESQKPNYMNSKHEKPIHIRPGFHHNKMTLVSKFRGKYSDAYLIPRAEQSMWWALRFGEMAGNLISGTCGTARRFVYGDMNDAARQFEMTTSRISLMCAQLAQNLRPSSLLVFLLQLATEFGFTPLDMVKKLLHLFSDASLCSTQLIQNMGLSVREFLVKWNFVSQDGQPNPNPPDRIEAEQSFDVDPQQAAACAGLLGGVAVILAAAFAGAKDYSPNKGFLKSIAEFGSKASKMKNGFYAVLVCVRDFSQFIRECVLNYFGSTPADSVVKAIDSLQYKFDGEPVSAEQIFRALTDLNTPEGEELMSGSEELLKVARATCCVLSKVVSGQLADTFKIPTGTVALLNNTLRTFEQRVKGAEIRQNVGNIKFVPYVVWISGEAGKGKSTAMTFLSRDLLNGLVAEDAMKYEVPSEDMRVFSANFTQEYHTGYHGQYLMRIDDICQDKPKTLKQSSAMQLIQWVSAIPSNVTQAALEDKKCPFVSKIVMCTSNLSHPNRDSEIYTNDAFLRRRNVVIRASGSDIEDPALKWNVKFELLDPLRTDVAPKRKFENYYDMAAYILEDYKVHFDRQKNLIEKVKCNSSDGFLKYLSERVSAEQSCQRRFVSRPDPTLSEEDSEESELSDSDEEWAPMPMFEYTTTDMSGTGETVTLQMIPDFITNIDTQHHLLTTSQVEYNRVMSVVSMIHLPTYRFLNGVLTSEDGDFTLSETDVRELAEQRPWEWDYTHVGESFDWFFETYSDPFEQSFWQTCKETAQQTFEQLATAVFESQKKMTQFWDRMVAHATWPRIFLALSGVAVACFGAYAAYKWRNWREIEAEESYTHDVGRAKPAAQMHKASYSHDVGRSRPQARMVSAVRSSFVESVFHKNMVTLRWIGGPLDEFKLNGLFIKDKMLLTCRHFFVGMSEGAMLEITRYPKFAPPISVQVAFRKENVIPLPGAEDAVLYNVVGGIDNFKDISKKFAKGVVPTEMDAAVPSLYPENETLIGGVSAFTKNMNVTYKMGTGAETATVVKGFVLNGFSRKGKSGSPLIADERTNRAPTIFGIQVAISSRFNSSYFEAISQDQIDAAMAEAEAQQSMLEQEDDRYDQEDEDAWFDAPEYIREMCKDSLEFVGPVKQIVPQPQQTRLRRSPLFETFEKLEGEKEYLPSVLRDSEVDVLAKSISGFSRKYGVIFHQSLDEVLREFIAEDSVVRSGGVRKLLTRDEILDGIHGQGLKGVELKTSPGIPLVFERGALPGKTKWITMGDDNQRTMSEEMWKVFDETEEKMRRGKRMNLTAYACLKDELRPLEKVEAKKTRTFIILPLIYNLLIRKYFGQWISKQHMLAGKISSCVGIDANTEWTALRQRLTAMGEEIEDFDYSDWDRSLHPEWFVAYADRVSAWYGDKKGSPGFVVRRALMDQLTYMNVQVGAWLLRTHGGNKSGCAITAEINTDIHDMLTYYVWNRICRDQGRLEIKSLSHFRERVSLALYGDDMLKATRKDVTHWFNGDAMKKVIEELGMHITPGDKNEANGFRIKTMDEVTFLKRRFISFPEDCGRVRAPLDKSVIQRIALWIHKSDSEIDATAENVRGALREAFFWGEDFFLDFRTRCHEAWCRSKCRHAAFPMVTYWAVADAWRSGYGDLLPARFQFSDVARPDEGSGEVE
uniref:Structural polyprotein n=1 Tax=Darwin bee virus 8 TaxID=2201283 RepID=A0A2U8JQ63_9VIRU|nr:structural polyprotein [Darwin bee virus 8]